jgi:broad specificity phosphatase PhoE
MTLVHLVRHGRTASNRERRTMGWLDEGIEPGWVQAAAAVADELAEEPVDRLVSSPLARAVQTAAPLAARLGRELIVDDRFGELRVGRWEGYAEDEIAERWPKHWQRWRSEPHALEVEWRETLAALNARVAGALDELVAGLLDGRVAVVFTHDAVVRAAVAWALGTGPEIYRHVEVANCSITTVGVVGGVRRLVRTNDKAHLGASPSNPDWPGSTRGASTGYSCASPITGERAAWRRPAASSDNEPTTLAPVPARASGCPAPTRPTNRVPEARATSASRRASPTKTTS